MHDEIDPSEKIVYIKDDQLICQNCGSYGLKVDLNKMEVAYAIIGWDLKNYLFLKDPRHHTIPVDCPGFEAVYAELSRRFHFDDDIFYSTFSGNEKTKNRIWKREYKSNFFESAQTTDAKNGFSILSDPPTFWYWDHRLIEYYKSELTFRQENEYKVEMLHFKHPIILANIKLLDLKANFSALRDDSPILNFRTDLRLENEGDQSYFLAKKLLTQSAGAPIKCTEKDDLMYATFQLEDLEISIRYFYDGEHNFESNFTSFNIHNKRDYPYLYEQPAYEEKCEISKLVIFEKELNFRGEYQRDGLIKAKPKKVIERCGEKPCIWLDEKNGVVGIAGKEFCYIIIWEDLYSLHIHNIHPAKGRGSSALAFTELGSNRPKEVLYGAYHVFKEYHKQLRQFVVRDLVIPPEVADT